MRISISGVILSGGESKRFGGIPKANIVVGGKTIISRMVEIIGDIFDEIIIVTNTPEIFKEFNHYKIVGDLFFNAGPLAGLHAAMKASSKEAVFVFAGDMPFLEKDLIITQINKYLENKSVALVPQIDKYSEPLHSIYSNSILNKLEDYLNETSEYAVRDFFEKIDVRYMKMLISDEILRSFTNINSSSDLIKIKNIPGI